MRWSIKKRDGQWVAVCFQTGEMIAHDTFEAALEYARGRLLGVSA